MAHGDRETQRIVEQTQSVENQQDEFVKRRIAEYKKIKEEEPTFAPMALDIAVLKARHKMIEGSKDSREANPLLLNALRELITQKHKEFELKVLEFGKNPHGIYRVLSRIEEIYANLETNDIRLDRYAAQGKFYEAVKAVV